MSRPIDSLQASYNACRRIGRGSRSNLYFGFPWLEGARRHGMDALYAFARLTDDLADSDLQVDERRRQLTNWRQALEGALGAPGRTSSEAPGAASSSGTNDPEDAYGLMPSIAAAIALPAVTDMVQRFSVPPRHLFALIDGAEMDLDRNRYETAEDLEAYCRCVASSIGLTCVHIWGYHDDAVFAPAEKCGIALQWTNILRDVKEDLARNRVYLPQTDLRKHQVTEADLRGGAADARFHSLMADMIDRTKTYYREGFPVLQWLEPDGRRMCGVILDRYRALLDAIGRHPEVVLQRRVTLPATTKARLALRWLLGGQRTTFRNV